MAAVGVVVVSGLAHTLCIWWSVKKSRKEECYCW